MSSARRNADDVPDSAARPLFVFLEFILPIARAAASLVGAQLLCVFALPERKLLDYYTRTLGFSRLPSKELESFAYERVKQDYDKGCIFLYQAL